MFECNYPFAFVLDNAVLKKIIIDYVPGKIGFSMTSWTKDVLLL
jgi:hypothetical protein